MRTLTRVGALVAAASAALLIAPSAHAAPGDNGTVKIHDATTGEELRKNEPHVCTFYLDGFGFDAGQQVDWRIEAWAPTAHVKGEVVKSDTLTLGADGNGRTTDLSLPDGHYKLFWNFDGEKGAAKHKVFWVDCEDKGQDTGQGEDDKGGATTPAASDSPSGTVESCSSPSPAGGAASPSSSPSAQGTGGDLAETGAGPATGLAAGAAVLLGAGGYLVFRRRKAHQA